MKKIFLIIPIVFLLLGCETKLKNVIKQDPVFVNNLKLTKRGNIISSFETKAIITATLLNSDDKNITFIVGVYNSDDDISGDNIGLYNSNYNLSLNDENSSKIELIEDKKAKELNLYNYPFYEKWMHYYIVDFNNSLENPYILEYKNKTYGAVKLIFNKEGE